MVQGDVNEFLSEHFKADPTELLSSLEPDLLLWRFNVVESFLAAGLPMTKIDELSGLLKQQVGPHTHLKAFIPKVEAYESRRLRMEIAGQKVTVIFDGTTRLGAPYRY